MFSPALELDAPKGTVLQEQRNPGVDDLRLEVVSKLPRHPRGSSHSRSRFRRGSEGPLQSDRLVGHTLVT